MNISDHKEVENIHSNAQGEKTQQNIFETCKTEGKCLTGLIREVASKWIFSDLLDSVYHTKQQRKPAMHRFCLTLSMGRQPESMLKKF